MSPAAASARELLAIQGILGAVLVAGLVVSQAGLTWVVPGLVLALLFGAWSWAVRVGRDRAQLDRDGVRAVSWRTGAGWGAMAALIHVALAAELPLPARIAVAVALGLGAGAAATILTLCGLDMGRPR